MPPAKKYQTEVEKREGKAFRVRRSRAFARSLEIGLQLTTNDGTPITDASQLTQEDIDEVNRVSKEMGRGQCPTVIKSEDGFPVKPEIARKAVESLQSQKEKNLERVRQKRKEEREAEALLSSGTIDNPEEIQRLEQIADKYRRTKELQRQRTAQKRKEMAEAEAMLKVIQERSLESDLDKAGSDNTEASAVIKSEDGFPAGPQHAHEALDSLQRRKERERDRVRRKRKEAKEAEALLNSGNLDNPEEIQRLEQIVEKSRQIKELQRQRTARKRKEMAEAEELLKLAQEQALDLDLDKHGLANTGSSTVTKSEDGFPAEPQQVHKALHSFQSQREKNRERVRQKRKEEREAEALLTSGTLNDPEEIQRLEQIAERYRRTKELQRQRTAQKRKEMAEAEAKLKLAQVQEISSDLDLDRIQQLAEKNRLRLEKCRERTRRQRANMWKVMTEEERNRRREKNRISCMMWHLNQTKEDRKTRYMAYYFKRQAKLAAMTPEEKEAERRRHNATCKSYYANATPEKRFKLLRAQKINQRKRLLRRELEAEGVPEPEIQARIAAMVEEIKAEPMPPPEQISRYEPGSRRRNQFSEYKPRGRKASMKVGYRYEKATPTSSSSFTAFTTSRPSEGHVFTPQLFGFGLVPETSNPTPSSSTVVSSASGIQPSPSIELVEAKRDSGSSPGLDQDEPVYYDFDHDDSDYHGDTGMTEDNENNDGVEDGHDYDNGEDSSTSNPASPLEGTASCPHCPEDCVKFNEDDLRSHILSSHPQKCWRCPKCPERMISAKDFQQHFQTHKAISKSYPKPDPSRKKPESPEAPHEKERMSLRRGKGKRKNDDSKNFLCLKCPFRKNAQGNRFESLEQLTKHVKRSHRKHCWPCPDCKLLKYSEGSLAIHRELCFTIKQEIDDLIK